MEDLIQLLFFAALIMFGLLARKKKKPPIVQKPRPRQVQPRPRPERSVADAAPVAESRAESEPARQRGLAEELFKMLQQQVEPVEREMPPAPPEPAFFEREPETLETLEPAGTTSHDRFHELYVEELPDESPPQPHDESPPQPHVEPYSDRAERKERLALTHKKLQNAFIMKEILGPPKGIE